MVIFKEVIFSQCKKKIIVGSTIDNYFFDHWLMTAEDGNQYVYIKCPVCLYTYRGYLATDGNKIKKSIEEFKPFYYRESIRKCPQHYTHLEIEKQCRFTSKK